MTINEAYCLVGKNMRAQCKEQTETGCLGLNQDDVCTSPCSFHVAKGHSLIHNMKENGLITK